VHPISHASRHEGGGVRRILLCERRCFASRRSLNMAAYICLNFSALIGEFSMLVLLWLEKRMRMTIDRRRERRGIDSNRSQMSTRIEFLCVDFSFSSHLRKSLWISRFTSLRQCDDCCANSSLHTALCVASIIQRCSRRGIVAYRGEHITLSS
jgi:hypothetical protein